MAFSPDQIKGVLGKFKPAIERAYTRTVNNIQGVLGKFGFVLDQASILVPDPPTVTTQAATLIKISTATGNGNITATGGENADARGFVYDTTSQSDPGDVAPGSTAYGSFVEDTGDFGAGAFTKIMTGMDKLTLYYFRAYAHNSGGYSYGSEQSFTTVLSRDRKGNTILRNTPNSTVVPTKNRNKTVLGTTGKDRTVLK